MADRPPPHRYRIIERGGRLEVLDTATGERPQSAAERMAAHDAAQGHAALRYDRMKDAAELASTSAPGPMATALHSGAGAQRPPSDPIRVALAERSKPWSQSSASRPQLGVQSASEAQARPNPGSGSPATPQRAAPAAEPVRGNTGRDVKSQTLVTGRWWDARGPRTLTLGQRGRARLTSGFMTALAVAAIIAIALLVVQPVLLLVAGFILFRFGSAILAPIGARLIDEALKADGTGR